MKHRKPRKLKKVIKSRGTLVYDVCTLPLHYKVTDVMYGFNREGIVLWASGAADNLSGRDCNNTPFVVNNTKLVKFIDVSKGFKKETK